MGIIYYAINEETKKGYELGKGGWVFLINDKGIIDCQNEEEILKIISEKIITEPGWTKEAVEDKKYHKKDCPKTLCIRKGFKIEVR